MNGISDEQAVQMNKEIAILMENQHEHVVRMIQVQETEMNIYCVMELVTKGPLNTFLTEQLANDQVQLCDYGR